MQLNGKHTRSNCKKKSFTYIKQFITLEHKICWKLTRNALIRLLYTFSRLIIIIHLQDETRTIVHSHDRKNLLPSYVRMFFILVLKPNQRDSYGKNSNYVDYFLIVSHRSNKIFYMSKTGPSINLYFCRLFQFLVNS